MAIVLDEKEADACIAALEADDDILISAGTVAEALIVAARRNVGEEVTSLIDGLGFEVVTVTPASARRIAQAYERWGKGVSPARRQGDGLDRYQLSVCCIRAGMSRWAWSTRQISMRSSCSM